jgi:hypothetical protein
MKQNKNKTVFVSLLQCALNDKHGEMAPMRHGEEASFLKKEPVQKEEVTMEAVRLVALSSCLVLSYLVLSCLVLSCLVLSCLVAETCHIYS